MPWFKLQFGLSETEAIGQLDQGADGIEADFAVWIHVAKMAHFHEAARKHMLEKASDEFHSVQCHGSPPVAVRLTVTKENGVIVHFHNATVGDGHFEDIRSQVFDGCMALPHCLAVDVPLDVPNLRRDEIEEPGFFHFIAELGPEDFGECSDRQIEVDS